MLKNLNRLFDSARTHQGFRRYFANTSWMFAEQILRLIAGLLVGIWVARYLGPEQFGVFSYAIAFAAIFGSIAKLGLDGIVVRDLVREPDQRDIYLGTAFWLKLGGALASLAAIAIAVQFTSNDRTTNIYIFIIASGLIFQSFEVVDFYFQSKVLSKFVSLCKIAQLLFSSLLKIYFVMTGADLFWFVVVSFVDQVTLALTLYIAYRYQKLGSFYRHFDLAIAKQLLKDSWPLIFSALVVMIYMRIDQIMIKEMLGEKEVGLYSAAVRLSEVWYFVPIIITNSLFPAIVSAKKFGEKLYYSRLQRLYTVMVWMAIAVAFITTILGNWLVVFLYGEAFREAGQVLVIHIWIGVFVCYGVILSRYLIVENKQSLINIHYAQSLVINIVLNFIFLQKIGVIGAALSTLISLVLSYILVSIYSKKIRDEMVMTLMCVLLLKK